MVVQVETVPRVRNAGSLIFKIKAQVPGSTALTTRSEVHVCTVTSIPLAAKKVQGVGRPRVYQDLAAGWRAGNSLVRT